MSRFLFVAIGGAGGDLQPLVAAALALRERGHEVSFAGDSGAGDSLGAIGLPARVLPAELSDRGSSRRYARREPMGRWWRSVWRRGRRRLGTP